MEQKAFDVAAAIADTMETQLVPFAPGAQALELQDELWVFVDDPSISSPRALNRASAIINKPLKATLKAVHYVLIYWAPESDESAILGLGRTAETVRLALHKLLDLPSTFDEFQQELIDETLKPIRSLNIVPVRMTLVDQDGNRIADAAAELIERVQSGTGMAFVEAEAGKGKSVLLAQAAETLCNDKRGKLPVFIPLRKLPLTGGIAWDGITQLIGVVGQGAERLVRAVKSGLVAVFLDGIDEVAGRYDKNLIRDLLNLITQRLGSPESVVILSGRRTEARHLHNSDWDILSVDLPDIASADFKAYVAAVFDGVVKNSGDAGQIELPSEYELLIGDRPADDQVIREKKYIIAWILEVFPDVAKEPSLFFVQGLAAIGIGRRSGNRASLHESGNKPYIPRIGDVCLSAAVYACIREASKVDQVARDYYTVKNQMRVLQGLAALASAPAGTLAPTPYELVPDAFGVDPVNAPEVHVAITRQNAKHALLYATEAAGAYRPQFLSDWIRSALLAQIFKTKIPLPKLSVAQTLQLAASAERAKYAFETLLPSALAGEPVNDGWRQALDRAIAAGSETASANLWFLRAAVGDDALAPVQSPLPLAEITDVEFTGFEFREELSGSDFLLDGNRFVNSEISNVRLQGVSVHDVAFENCKLTNVELVDCEGPIVFETCEFNAVRLTNIRSKKVPAMKFIDCSFNGDTNLIAQEVAAYGADTYASPVSFEDCVCDVDVDELIKGEWAAKEDVGQEISRRLSQEMTNAEACLRRALGAFFPSTVGIGRPVQARPYIRLSALGRGSMPAGAPGQEALKQIFESVGFTTGGRADHLYGPWSSVAGATQTGMALRTELLEFLRDGSQRSPRVQQMISRIERQFP